MKAVVTVMLKNGVLDPQGKAIGHALNNLGFAQVGEVRAGKIIELELAETDPAAAQAAAEGRQCRPTMTRPSDSSPVGALRVAAIGSRINSWGPYSRVRVYVRTPGGAVRAPPLDRRPGVH